MKIIQFCRSSSELSSQPIICCFSGKRHRKILAYIYHENSQGGMGLAPHLVCKTSVTVKNLLAAKRHVVAHKVPWWDRFLLSLSTCVERFLKVTVICMKFGKCGNSVSVALPRYDN